MMEFIRQYKYHILILTALILMGLTSGYVGFFAPTTHLQASQPPVIQSTQLNTKDSPDNDPKFIAPASSYLTPSKPAKNTINTVKETKKVEAFVYTNVDKIDNATLSNLTLPTTSASFSLNKGNNTTSTGSKNVENAVPATLKVYNSVYKLYLPQENSVYDLMKGLRAQTDFSFSGKEFGSDLGFFVEEINGQRQNPKEGKYWIYYINDKQATSGISTYIIQPNDLIEWKI